MVYQNSDFLQRLEDDEIDEAVAEMTHDQQTFFMTFLRNVPNGQAMLEDENMDRVLRKAGWIPSPDMRYTKEYFYTCEYPLGCSHFKQLTF